MLFIKKSYLFVVKFKKQRNLMYLQIKSYTASVIVSLILKFSYKINSVTEFYNQEKVVNNSVDHLKKIYFKKRANVTTSKKYIIVLYSD